MIRTLSLLILLGASAIVLAQPLYKWVEADGSITFSVTPPPAGVAFETVTADSRSNKQTSATGNAASTVAEPALKQALSASTHTNQPTQRIAPQLGAQTTNNTGIQRSTDDPGNSSSASTNAHDTSVMGATAASALDTLQNSSDQNAALNARSRKKRQCEDLQKRVVSLERRLKTRLTPDDMDNTVVHMARYQRSYDQHCAQ